MGLALATTVLVSRALGPAGRGYFAVAVATGALGVQFGTLGLHTANAYFVAKQPNSLSALAGNSLAVSACLGGFIMLALWVLFYFSPNLLTIHGPLLWLALAWIPCGLAYTLTQNLLLGIQDVRGYNLAEIGTKAFPLLLIAIMVLAGRTSVAELFSSTFLAMALGVFWVLLRLGRQSLSRATISLDIFTGCLRYALKAYMAATFCFLVLRADLFMVQHMLGAEQAGYYSVASTMADYASMLAVVIGSILFPRLAAIADVKEKLALTWKATTVTTLILFPFLSLACVLASPAVRILFGPAFLPASLAFILLMPGMLFLGIHMVCVQFLNSIGYPKIVVVIWGLCSFLNIILNLWAIPTFGIAGASVVSSISYFFAFAGILWVIYRTGRIATRNSVA
jgi:O-antigen/teichoic acid export membrane protein